MDAEHFDALTRSLSSAASSRRRLLRGLAGSAVATVATALGFAEAGATHAGCRHVGKGCKTESQCCSGVCKHGRCKAHNVGSCTADKELCLTLEPRCGGDFCYCFRTTGQANYCAAAVYCMDCTTDAECATALSAPGAACVVAGDCVCGSATTACAKPCPK